MKRIAIIGAGGCAREIHWLIEEINRAQPEPQYKFMGYVVSDVKRLGPRDSGAEVLGDFGWLERNSEDVEALALGIGTPAVKLRISTELKARFPKLQWPVLIDPHVRVDSGSCTFGEGVIICAGSIITVNVKFEPFSMVNIGSVIAHESVIGAYVVVNQLANICGGVVLGKGVLVGSGARVLQYLTVGEDAAVGAGAVVTKDVEPGVTVVGIPARPLCKTARHSN